MIIIHPFARPLKDGRPNPKNYPHWKELIQKIEEPIIQVGVDGEQQLVKDFRKNLSLPELSALIKECRTWVGVDSFFQHLCWDLGKSGIVLWGQSDPLIFGHPENINLLKDRKYLRKDQFLIWDGVNNIPDSFVSTDEIISSLSTIINPSIQANI